MASSHRTSLTNLVSSATIQSALYLVFFSFYDGLLIFCFSQHFHFEINSFIMICVENLIDSVQPVAEGLIEWKLKIGCSDFSFLWNGIFFSR